MYILSEKEVEKACNWIKPAVETILEDNRAIWGPRYVYAMIEGPGLKFPIKWLFGKYEPWREEWGEEKYFEFTAKMKLFQALRNEEPTSITVNSHPWAIDPKEFFYPGGVAVKGLGVGVSGAKGITDERIAWMIFHALALACQLEKERLEEKGIKQLPL
ncbi:hypothetical protein AMJ51_00845 [Microgenomates bacterium DG_75]|nr:MAG: hypothetical protein AMJ51_00845 [Microgenomates bacterium DG_75]